MRENGPRAGDECLAHPMQGTACKLLGPEHVQKRQNALVRGFAVDRLLAPAGQALQPINAMIGKAPAPDC